jgi:multidrug efflux pump subunit AcrB
LSDKDFEMLQLVLIALRRPYTFVVAAILIVILGGLAIFRTPVDIFPAVGIPVVSVIWTYVGLSPDDMSTRILYPYELALTALVNDIDHVESQSYSGIGVNKIYFQPKVKIDLALAQVGAAGQTVLRLLPPGVQPPQVILFNASTVPVIQIAFSSATRTEAEVADAVYTLIRPPLTTVTGAAVPFPYGGKSRQVRIDLDQEKLLGLGLTAQDVVTAVERQNLIIPAGTQKIGDYEYAVLINDAPAEIAALNDFPIKRADGAIVYLRDVAHVHNGNAPQTNLVRVDGAPAVLLPVLTSGSASSLDVINGVKAMLPRLKLALPDGIEMTVIGDQSDFINGAVVSVAREAAIAAGLTGLMILLFLGSWRSTIIITISIPLSILAALFALSALGETVNVMTLGGLALAVGLLVDDATVTIENVNRHMEAGEAIDDAIVKAAKEIITPATVSLLCICIVFAPLLLLGGVAGYLFRPLAEAVVFAMIASYFLTYTLVETMARYFLSAQQRETLREAKFGPARRGLVIATLTRAQLAFERGFERLLDAYARVLQLALARPKAFVAMFFAGVALSFTLIPFLGRDFFPETESSSLRLHVRLPTGTRLEQAGVLCDRIESEIRDSLPHGALTSIVDNIGLPISGINLSYNNSGTIGTNDADLTLSFDPEKVADASPFAELLRERLPRAFPGVVFSFLPADIVTQILNFGLPAPLDIQISGSKRDENLAYLQKTLERVARVPGVADPRMQQAGDLPTLHVDVDRTLAQEVGLSERDVTVSLQTMLAGSFQTSPAFWLNVKSGVSYPIVTMEPQFWNTSLDALASKPVAAGEGQQILSGVASIRRGWSSGVVTHFNSQSAFDIYAGVRGRDLGAIADDVQKILDDTRKEAPAASNLVLRGQIATMRSAYADLLVGLILSIVFVYLIIVVNFQSWLDPFLIVSGLPTALAGIVWMLFLSETTISVPALTGAIMCMGVATANSNLVIAFARERLDHGDTPLHAAAAAGVTRFRPVIMTALAMIIGMAPMALSAEQNAPLGRAVIGGLTFATLGTLLLLPVMFSLAHGFLACGRAWRGQDDAPENTELEQANVAP